MKESVYHFRFAELPDTSRESILTLQGGLLIAHRDPLVTLSYARTMPKMYAFAFSGQW